MIPERKTPIRARSALTIALFCAGLAGCAHEGASSAPRVPADDPWPARVRIDFQDGTLGSAPAGFTPARSGDGAPGTWVVLAGDTPGAHVLAQTSTDDTDARYPVCVLEGFVAQDASVSARFRAVAGEVDRAAGLVARYRDAGHYYIVRANALEDNVRLYKVVAGKRKQFAGASVEVTSDDWHSLRLDLQGSRFAVFFDEQLLFTAEDDTFPDAGRIGLWTKADSVTWFDDLMCGPVAPR